MILLSHSYGHVYGWSVSSLFSRSGSSTQPSHQNTDWCRLRWYVHHLFRLTLCRKKTPEPRTLWSLMRKSWMRKIWKILKNTVVNCKIYWEMLQYVKLIPSLHRLHPNLIVFLHQWLKWWNPRQSRCWWLAFAIVVVPTLPSMRLVRCHPQSHRWRRGPCPSPFGRKLGKWWKMKVRSNFWLWGNT